MMFNTKIVRLFLLNLSLSLSLSFTSFLLICVHLKRIGISSDSIFFARDKTGRRFDKIFRQVTLAFHKWVLLRRTHARKCMIDVCVTGFVRSDGEQHVSYGRVFVHSNTRWPISVLFLSPIAWHPSLQCRYRSARACTFSLLLPLNIQQICGTFLARINN